MKPEISLSLSQEQLCNCREITANSKLDGIDKAEITRRITRLNTLLMETEYDYAHRRK